MKLRVYAAVIGATVLLLLAALVLGRWQLSVSIEPLEPEATPVEPLPDHLAVTAPAAAPLPNPTPAPSLTTAPESAIAPPKNSQPSVAKAGTLRVSNQSDHPIRVALLSKQSAAKSSNPSRYGKPAHWDFAPGEGGTKGLLLSLPDGNLKLDLGDILVAFAQDGSRRYWGPYVVGETALPIWNREASEWQLILQP